MSHAPEAIVPRMATAAALSSGDLTKIGLIATAALLLVGVLLSIVITKLVGRVVILVVVVAAGVLVWQQRAHVKQQLDSKKCHASATFFGVHVDVPYCPN